MREHVVTDHLGRKVEHVRKTNRTVLLVVVGALLLLLCGSFLRPLAFLVAVPALIWGAYVNQDSETWSSGRAGEMLFRRTLRGLELSDSWAAWYGVPVGRNKDGEIIDTDCVLLGPGGLFVFEVKHYNGFTVCKDGGWGRLKRGRRGKLYRGRIGSPSGQAAYNLRSLKEWIERTGKATWVQGLVVFTNIHGEIAVKGISHVKAIKIDQLPEVIPRERKILNADALSTLTDAIRTYCSRPV
jgi:hypothetical protein